MQESLQSGADLVTFSGDKLLGGPQAGLILGQQAIVAQLRRHPMARALRVDKMTLAALEATLRAYLRGRAAGDIPVWRMIAAADAELQSRSRPLAGLSPAAWHRGCVVGGRKCCRRREPSWRNPAHVAVGGILPPNWCKCRAAAGPAAIATRLRLDTPAVVCRIQKDHLVFDARTVLPWQEQPLLDALLVHLGA